MRKEKSYYTESEDFAWCGWTLLVRAYFARQINFHSIPEKSGLTRSGSKHMTEISFEKAWTSKPNGSQSEDALSWDICFIEG